MSKTVRRDKCLDTFFSEKSIQDKDCFKDRSSRRRWIQVEEGAKRFGDDDIGAETNVGKAFRRDAKATIQAELNSMEEDAQDLEYLHEDWDDDPEDWGAMWGDYDYPCEDWDRFELDQT